MKNVTKLLDFFVSSSNGLNEIVQYFVSSVNFIPKYVVFYIKQGNMTQNYNWILWFAVSQFAYQEVSSKNG